MRELPEAARPENPPAVPAVRASDADRDRAAAAVQAAFAEGRLTMPELEERLAQVYAAGTDAELATVTRDLRASAPQPGDWAGAAPTSIRDTGMIAGFGGFDHHDEGPGTPGAPKITITGFVFCGSVDVQRRSASAQAPDPKLKRAQRRLERKHRQLERKRPR